MHNQNNELEQQINSVSSGMTRSAGGAAGRAAGKAIKDAITNVSKVFVKKLLALLGVKGLFIITLILIAALAISFFLEPIYEVGDWLGGGGEETINLTTDLIKTYKVACSNSINRTVPAKTAQEEPYVVPYTLIAAVDKLQNQFQNSEMNAHIKGLKPIFRYKESIITTTVVTATEVYVPGYYVDPDGNECSRARATKKGALRPGFSHVSGRTETQIETSVKTATQELIDTVQTFNSVYTHKYKWEETSESVSGEDKHGQSQTITTTVRREVFDRAEQQVDWSIYEGYLGSIGMNAQDRELVYAIKGVMEGENPRQLTQRPLIGIGEAGESQYKELEGFIYPMNHFSRISSPFGMRKHPVTGKYWFHNGIDLPAPYGTPVYSSESGTVRVGYNTTAGNWITVVHEGGVSTFYCHLSSNLVKHGDMVDKGDPIGLVGSTGRSTGNHLHFSIFENGKEVDPTKRLKFFK